MIWLLRKLLGLCIHDWQPLTTADLLTENDIPQGKLYVKECSKCHRIWTQRSGL